MNELTHATSELWKQLSMLHLQNNIFHKLYLKN